MNTFIVLLAIVVLVVAAALTSKRGAHSAPTTTIRPTLFRHPIRPALPAALQTIIQDGELEATFRDALVPDFLFPSAAAVEPVAGNVGQRITRTRTGLLAPVTTAITGSDPTPSNYTMEQYSGVLDQFGNSTDTNMLGSVTAQASTFMRAIQLLGINAGQSLNRIARDRLYAAYAGGRSWCRTADAGSNVSFDVQSVDGFEFVLVNGVPTAVSAAAPLTVTIANVANTVTGVNRTTRVLTLGTARVDVVGDAIIAANAPITLRPNARTTAFNIVAGDFATVGLFFDAVARLRAMNVPTFPDGTYQAHVDATTMRQLLSDTEFRQAFQSQGPNDTYTQGRLTIFGGVTFALNMEVPTVTGDSQSLTIRRPIVLGAEPLIAMPLENQGQMLDGTGVEDVPGISLVEVAAGTQVVLIVRPPQDRLQQVVSASWAWTGDYSVPTDSTTGDAALVKRAVVIEHL